MQLINYFTLIVTFTLLISCQSENKAEQNNQTTTNIEAEALYQKAKQQATKCFNKKQGCSEAVELLNEVIKNDSTNHLAFYNRGVCKMILTDFKDALDDFSKAIELNSEDFDYYHNKGYVELQLGMMDEACKDLKISRSKGDKTVNDVIKQICRYSN